MRRRYRLTGSNPRVLFHRLRLPGEIVTCTPGQAAQVNEETPGLLEPVDGEREAKLFVEIAPERAPDPSKLTVSEIQELDLTPEQWAELLAAEHEGQGRVTVLRHARRFAEVDE